jgi:hypothetical protein
MNTMKKKQSKDQFWLVLGALNLLAMAYPITAYVRADSMEEQILAIFVMVGIGLLLAIVDTVTIAVTYSS